MVTVKLSEEILKLIQSTLTGIDYNLCIKKRETDTSNGVEYDILYLRHFQGLLPWYVKLATLKKGGTILNRDNYHQTDLTKKTADALESFLKIVNFK